MSFSKLIGAWSSKAEKRIDATYKRSVEILADEMSETVRNDGNVPFLTGNLSRSLLASTSGMPRIGGKDQRYDGQEVGIVTATLTTSTPVWLGYQAVYARRMNYGFVGADAKGRVYNQNGHHFVEKALAAWTSIVDRAAKQIKVE